MMYLKRAYPAIIVLFIMMALAACGGSTSSGGGGYNSTPATATTSNSSSSSNALVKTSTVTVDGKSETILTDAKGKTLYYFTPDTATTTACTGSCAKKWPPLVATGSSAPASTSSLQGKLTTLTTANGNQIEYNGHFLYTFAGDGGPGQTNGNKLFDKWFVATPDLTIGSNGSGSNALIKTSTVTVDGKSETILTDAKGKTLYYFTPDTATTTACTSSCAQNWPPLLETGSGTSTSATTLPGKLSTQTTTNGNQIEYNGHFLYTFAGDSNPGQTNGNKLFGKWFVATPNLK